MHFYMSVSVRQVSQCQKVDVGQVIAYSYVNGNAELSIIGKLQPQRSHIVEALVGDTLSTSIQPQSTLFTCNTLEVSIID